MDLSERIPQRILGIIRKHPDWPNHRVSVSVRGASAAVVQEVRARAAEAVAKGELPADIVPPPFRAPTAEVKKETPTIISLDKVKTRYDVKAAIERELSKLFRGKLISEDELRQRTAGKDRNRFRKVVDNNPELVRPLRIKISLGEDEEPRWYWGHKDDVAEAKAYRDG